MMCAFKRRCRNFRHTLHSRLTSQDDAANDLVGLVTVSSQYVCASARNLAPARILRSPNWSMRNFEAFLTQHTLIEREHVVATSAKRKRCGDCRHAENGGVAERFVVCFKVDFNAQIRCFFRRSDALVQAFQVWDAKLVVLAFGAIQRRVFCDKSVENVASRTSPWSCEGEEQTALNVNSHGGPCSCVRSLIFVR